MLFLCSLPPAPVSSSGKNLPVSFFEGRAAMIKSGRVDNGSLPQLSPVRPAVAMAASYGL